MEDQIQSGLCLTTSRLDATDRSDMERVAAETMLELWLRSVNKADDCESSNTSPSSVTSASSSTRTACQSGQGLFGWQLALSKSTKIGDLFGLNSTVLIELLTAKTQSTKNKNVSPVPASERHRNSDDERTDWNLHDFIKQHSEADISSGGEDPNFW